MLNISLFILVGLLMRLRLGKSDAQDCDSRVLIVAAHVSLELIARYAPLGLHPKINRRRGMMGIIFNIRQEARGTF